MSEKNTFDNLPKAVGALSDKLENMEKWLHEQLGSQNQPLPDQLLTVEQTAEFLNLSIPTIYSKVNRRELPVSKRGKRLYFSRAELLEYVKIGRRKTNEEISKEADAFLSRK